MQDAICEMRKLDITKTLPKLIICIGVVFSSNIFNPTSNLSWAQDIHFSLLDLDPLLFNPAYSGFYEGTGRFGAVYRNQWASVSTPFQTVTATAEMALLRSQRNRNGLSGGMWISADRAGTLHYGITQAALIASYFQAVDQGDNLVSVAVEGGIGQVGFSTDGILMGEGEESFDQTSHNYWTLGAGVAWFGQWSEKFYTKVGFAMRNINQPQIAFMETSGDQRLAMRWNLYGRAEWRAWRTVSVLPVVGYQHQAAYSELVYGCDARWYLNERPSDYLAFSAGLMGRHGDAMTVNLAVLWHEWTFALSYDANLSKLAEASHTLGAFEIGILYIITKKDRRTSAIPCPIF